MLPALVFRHILPTIIEDGDATLRAGLIRGVLHHVVLGNALHMDNSQKKVPWPDIKNEMLSRRDQRHETAGIEAILSRPLP